MELSQIDTRGMRSTGVRNLNVLKINGEVPFQSYTITTLMYVY